MIAALPFYDPPVYRDLTDALWSAVASRLADRGIEAPATLTRSADLEADYARADLLVSQCCGHPWLEGAGKGTALVGAQALTCDGGGAGRYRSAVVRRREDSRDLEDLRIAINSECSVSGWLSLRRFMEVEGVTARPHLVTGAHLHSLAAVREGRADLAAIDCVYWHIARAQGWDAGLEQIGWTESVPSPPYITSLNTSSFVREFVRLALSDAMRDPTVAAYRAAFGIADVVKAAPDAYELYRGWQQQAA